MSKERTLRVLGAVAALSALTVVGAASASADDAAPVAKKTRVVKIEQKGKKLFFSAPESIAAGDNLKIKNKTNPKKVGPHTFSLVKEKDIPTSNSAIKKCGKKLEAICGAIAGWHKFDPSTGQVNENPVEVGKQGWDKQGSLKQTGDSWYTEVQGDSFVRPVTAKSGKVLHYICAVHPDMQGEITVTEG